MDSNINLQIVSLQLYHNTKNGKVEMDWIELAQDWTSGGLFSTRE
jgi:hypothetical protein